MKYFIVLAIFMTLSSFNLNKNAAEEPIKTNRVELHNVDYNVDSGIPVEFIDIHEPVYITSKNF